MSILPKYQLVLIILYIFTIIKIKYYINNYTNVQDITHYSPLEIKGVFKRLGTGYYLQPCNCIKHAMRSGRNSTTIGIKSTCSDEGDWYGPNQKILSYVLHEDKNPKGDPFHWFVDGIISNIYQVKKLYPGWIIRLYTDHNLTEEFCNYACMDEVMWCDIRLLTFANLLIVNFRMWRFMVLGDPTVDIFVSRDIDSLICEREREAVADWEISTKSFHVARDSGTHHGITMLAGLWGAKNYLLDSNISIGLRNKFIQKGTRNYHFRLDEYFLKVLLFDKYESDILAHDSYTCNKWPKSSVPFPKQRKNKFTRLALSIRLILLYQARPCPMSCRPSYGKNWTYC